MNEPPHPSTLGEILDRTAQFYRARFLVFFGIAVVPTGIVLVFAFAIFLFVAWSGPAHSSAAGIVAVIFFAALALVGLPAYLSVNALASAAMNHAVARAWQDEKSTIRDAYKAVWRRGWHYIWLYVLEALIVWIAPMAAWFVLFIPTAIWSQKAGASASTDTLLGLAAFLLTAVLAGYALWMLLEVSLAFPACVVEQTGAWAAVKRSAALTQGTRGRIFVLYLLGTVLNYLLTMAVTVPVLIAMAFIPGANSPQHAQTAGMVVMFTVYGAAFSIQALTRPVYGIALVLFYYDQRIRKEGFDIEWMMQQAGLVVAPTPQPEALPWLPAIPRKTPTSDAAVPTVDTEATLVTSSEAEPAAVSALQPQTASEFQQSPEQPPSPGDPA